VKVGDLVELSAAGKKLQFLGVYRGKHGIILKSDSRMGYTVQWFGASIPNWRNGQQRHYRKELKHLKKRNGVYFGDR
jgi:hypothetical protein